MFKFTLFQFFTTSVILTIANECNADGYEEGSVATYGINKVTGRILTIDITEYVGFEQKRIAIARALRGASELI